MMLLNTTRYRNADLNGGSIGQDVAPDHAPPHRWAAMWLVQTAGRARK
jgi:hypothetical protein